VTIDFTLCMTSSDAAERKHVVNLRRCPSAVPVRDHAILPSLIESLSRTARSRKSIVAEGFYASVFPSRWAVTVLDWLILAILAEEFFYTVELKSHSHLLSTLLGLRRGGWRQTRARAPTVSAALLAAKGGTACPFASTPRKRRSANVGSSRQEKASATPRGGFGASLGHIGRRKQWI